MNKAIKITLFFVLCAKVIASNEDRNTASCAADSVYVILKTLNQPINKSDIIRDFAKKGDNVTICDIVQSLHKNGLTNSKALFGNVNDLKSIKCPYIVNLHWFDFNDKKNVSHFSSVVKSDDNSFILIDVSFNSKSRVKILKKDFENLFTGYVITPI